VVLAAIISAKDPDGEEATWPLKSATASLFSTGLLLQTGLIKKSELLGQGTVFLTLHVYVCSFLEKQVDKLVPFFKA
jgi:hypothetical protein